jgi:hypothetical protein
VHRGRKRKPIHFTKDADSEPHGAPGKLGPVVNHNDDVSRRQKRRKCDMKDTAMWPQACFDRPTREAL